MPDLAISGSVSVNVIVDTTEASIQAVLVTSANDVSVSAENRTGVGSLVISTATSQSVVKAEVANDTKTPAPDPKPGEEEPSKKDSKLLQSASASGAVAVNVISNDTRAFVDRSDLSLSGNLQISSDSLGVIAGVAVATAKTDIQKEKVKADPDDKGSEDKKKTADESTPRSIGAAGAVAVNVLVLETFAFITRSTVTTTGGGVSVEATKMAINVGVAGASATSAGAGIGASVGVNVLNGQTHAYLVDSNVTADLDLTVKSRDLGVVASVAGAGAIAKGSLAMPVSVSVNVVDADTRSFIDVTDHSKPYLINTGGDLIIIAEDTSVIGSIAGVLGIAKQGEGDGSAALGAAVGINIVASTVDSYIDGAHIEVDLTGPASINENTDTIHFASAHGFSNGDAVVYSNGGDKVIGGLQSGRTYYVIVQGLDSIQLTTTKELAFDGTSDVDLNLPAEKGDGHAFRLVDGLELDAAGLLTLSTSNTMVIGSLAISGQGAADFAAGGAVTVNVVDADTISYLRDATVTSAGAVSLDAFDKAVIAAVAGAIQIAVRQTKADEEEKDKKNAVSASVGASAAVNVIGGSIRSFIESVLLSSAGDVTLTTTSDSMVWAFTIAGSGAGARSDKTAATAALAGAGSYNEVRKTIVSSITNGSTVLTSAVGNVELEAQDLSVISANAGAGESLLDVTNGLATDINTKASAEYVATVKDEHTLVVTNLNGDLFAVTFVNPASGILSIDDTINEAEIDAAADLVILEALRADFEAKGVILVGELRLSSMTEGKSWALTTGGGLTYFIEYDGTQFSVSQASISAVTAAASLAAGFSFGGASVAISGAGAFGMNIVLTDTQAFIENSTIDSSRDVRLEANNSSGIASVTGALAASAAIGSGTSVGVSIGAAVAINYIGYEWDSTSSPAAVYSYISDSSVDADRDVILSSSASQTIGAITLAGSVALAASGGTGVAVAGSGVLALNMIGADVKSYIDGDVAIGGGMDDGIRAVDLSLTARDTSTITALVGAASIAVSFGNTGVSVAIGVSFGHNMITSNVADYIASVDHRINASGDITVKADETSVINVVSSAAAVSAGFGSTGVAISGAGAEASNLILTKTNAYMQDSTIKHSNSVEVIATNTSEIKAIIVSTAFAVAAGSTGVGISVGVSLAGNVIGWEKTIFETSEYTYTTGNEPQCLIKGNRVKIESGVRAGNAYEYVAEDVDLYKYTSADGFTVLNNGDLVKLESGYGEDDPDDNIKGAGTTIYRYIGGNDVEIDLGSEDYTNSDIAAGDPDLWESVGSARLTMQDYGNTDLWRQVNLEESPIEVQAYVLDSSLKTDGILSVKAVSNQIIEALVISGSVAASAGGTGVSVAGAGVGAMNLISANVRSYIDGDGDGIKAGSISLNADDTSTIKAITGAATLAAGFGGTGVAVAIGVAVAHNGISNDISSFITSAENSVSTTSGAITISAKESSSISTVTTAASVSIAIGGTGVAVSGAGAAATNSIQTRTNAYVEDSVLSTTGIAGDVIIEATDSSIIDATVAAVAVAVAGGGTGVGVSIGAALASNMIGYDLLLGFIPIKDAAQVRAYVENATITATGDVKLTAMADEAITSRILSGSVAIAAGGVGVGVGGSGVIAVNLIATDINAYISGSSNVTGKSVILNADDTSRIMAYAGAAAITGGFGGTGVAISIGAALAHNQISNEVEAYVKFSTVNTTSGNLTIQAFEDAAITATSVAASAAVSAGIFSLSISGGGATAINTIATQTGAFVSQSDLDIVGNLDIHASGTFTSSALTGSASDAGGLISVAMGGSIAIATVSPTIEAYIINNADKVIDVAGSVSVTSLSSVKADIKAYGVAAGTLGVGVSSADAWITPVINTYISGGTVNAGQVRLLSLHNVNEDGNMIPDRGAFTEATASAGGLIGVNGAAATSTTNADLQTYVASGSTLTVTGMTTIMSLMNGRNTAKTDGRTGGAIAIGSSSATASSDSRIEANIGDNVSLVGEGLVISACGEEDNHTESISGVGGAIAVSASTSTTTNTSTTRVSIGSGSVSRAIEVDSLWMIADHKAKFNGQSDGSSGGAIDASGATITNTVNATVDAEIGENAYIRALNLDVQANNRILKDWLPQVGDATPYNLISASGGVGSFPAGTSETTIVNNTTVDIGEGARIYLSGQGASRLTAYNNVVARDKAKLDSGGALAVARTESIIRNDTNTALITVGGDANINSVGDMRLSAYSDADIDTTANTRAYGAAGYAQGKAISSINADNNIKIKAGALLRTDSNISLTAGADGDGNGGTLNAKAQTDLWNKSAFPIPSNPTADAIIIANSNINIESGAWVGSLQDVNLKAVVGDLSARGNWSYQDLYLGLAEDIAGGLSNLFDGGDVSLKETGGYDREDLTTTVTVDGTVEAGIQNKQFLIIDENLIAEGDIFLQGNPVLDFQHVEASDTLTRNSGSWVDDEFTVGAFVTISGTDDNDGLYRIDEISLDGLTLYLDPGYHLDNTAEDNDAEVSQGIEMWGTHTIDFGNDDDRGTITRSYGSFSEDGFAVNQKIVVNGAGENDRFFNINEISPDGSMIYLNPGETLYEKDNVSNISIKVVEDQIFSMTDPGF